MRISATGALQPAPAITRLKPLRLASVDAYEAVFEMLAERGLYVAARAMLCVHYRAPKRVTTMRHLAAAVLHVSDHRRANFVYGQFAARVRRECDLARPRFEIWVLGTWPEPPVDDLGEFAFRLRPEVARAVERLGWVTA